MLNRGNIPEMSACPFCGQPADSKEHVWPKWLRNYRAFTELNIGKRGERFLRTEYPHSGDARFTRRIAAGLPNVTAEVCAECNNGWMSAMETKVCQLLDSAMRTDELIGPTLGQADQTLLAAWFSKCAYAYEAAIFSEPNRAWSPALYRELKQTQQPPATATIWLGKNIGLCADIALSTTPVYAISLEPLASHEPDQAELVGAWLSANSIVIFGLWVSPDMQAADMAARLAAEDVSAMTRIWPPSNDAVWPTAYTSDDQALSLINLLATIREQDGIRVDELDYDQIEEIKSQMRANAAANGLNPSYAIVNRVRATR